MRKTRNLVPSGASVRIRPTSIIFNFSFADFSLFAPLTLPFPLLSFGSRQGPFINQDDLVMINQHEMSVVCSLPLRSPPSHPLPLECRVSFPRPAPLSRPARLHTAQLPATGPYVPRHGGVPGGLPGCHLLGSTPESASSAIGHAVQLPLISILHALYQQQDDLRRHRADSVMAIGACCTLEQTSASRCSNLGAVLYSDGENGSTVIGCVWAAISKSDGYRSYEIWSGLYYH